MAATELNPASRASRARRVWRAVAEAYLALWCGTFAGAALTAVLAAKWVREAMRLALSGASNPGPSVGGVLRLAGHNLPICAWPLLLGSLGLPRASRLARAADVLVIGAAVANVAPLGGALGAYGGRLVAFVPQLPLEWAALAVGYGSWASERERPLALRVRLGLLVLISALVLGAAVLETCAVPHR